MDILKFLPVGQYGKGKAKTIGHLLREIESGETQIQWKGEKPLRVTQLVCIDVVYGPKRLLEEKQVFSDGRMRQRTTPSGEPFWGVREKLHPGEDPYEGAIRAMNQELGIDHPTSISFVRTDEEEAESPSYPGLTTLYVISNYTASISEADYKPEGYVEVQDDKSTFFVWR